MDGLKHQRQRAADAMHRRCPAPASGIRAGIEQRRGNTMAYEDLVLFVSFGWFISVAVIFIMYVRIRHLVEEVRMIKNTVQLSDDEMIGV